MAIPNGVILIWTGTHASIPTGWTRETLLDDKFPKAWGVQNPNVTGGSNTHTHTSPAHNHIIASHTHTYTYNWGVIDENRESGPFNLSDGAHKHENQTTDNPNAAYTSSNAVTYGSSNNEPPYYKVIFIKPSGVVAPLPAGICAHYYGSSAPILWNFCDGNNSTPDLRNKYLKGALTNGDAGVEGGGLTHIHDISHGHTGNTHTHNFTTAVYDVPNVRNYNDSNALNGGHTHTGVTGASSAVAVNNFSGSLSTTESVEPAYKKLGVIKATVGAERKGLVGLWLGSTASIPNGWVLCDGNNGTYDLRDKFIKIGADLTENNSTGGANTHTHAAQGHTHTGISHTHTLPRVYHSGGSAGAHDKYDGNSQPIYSWVYHEAITSNPTTDSWASANTTADSSDNQPAYRTVAYIQLMKVSVGGSMMMI